MRAHRFAAVGALVVLAFLACVADRSTTGTISLGACVGNVAKEIPASECPASCSGAEAYALCDGKTYTTCACSLPGGFKLVDGDGGMDAEPESDGSVSPLDGQALGIGACSGKVALAIPSAECPSLCPGAIAYALCEGNSYSECACTIPKGYTLAVFDSGVPEAGLDSGRDAEDASDAEPLDARDGG
jgi:hypothetical protein